MLAIPYLTASGVTTLRFRCIQSHDCKEIEHHTRYRSVPGDTPRIYNPTALNRQEDYLCVCEGEIDTMTAHAAGLPTIGVGGASAWKKIFRRCIQGYGTVYVLADADDSGSGMQLARQIVSEVPHGQIVSMPTGHDVNSLVQARGYPALRELVNV